MGRWRQPPQKRPKSPSHQGKVALAGWRLNLRVPSPGPSWERLLQQSLQKASVPCKAARKPVRFLVLPWRTAGALKIGAGLTPLWQQLWLYSELHAVQEGLNSAASSQIRIWIWSRCLGWPRLSQFAIHMLPCQCFCWQSGTRMWVWARGDHNPSFPSSSFSFSWFSFFFSSEQWARAGQTLSTNTRSQNVCSRAAEKQTQEYKSNQRRENWDNTSRRVLELIKQVALYIILHPKPQELTFTAALPSHSRLSWPPLRVLFY